MINLQHKYFYKATEKLLSMYSKDPEGAKDVEKDIAETKDRIEQLEKCKAELESASEGFH